jgi:undecaprenyl-diphosphatase
MSIFQAIILGLVQGITEFLPISSSGHLVIFQKLFGLQEGVLVFDVAVHFATLLAVVSVMWREIVEIIKRPFARLPLLLLAATIPTIIIGFVFKDYFEELLKSGRTLGLEFIFTGLVLWYAENVRRKNKKVETTSFFDAAFIGAAQGAAILPAVSRSGLTLAGALFRGLNREFAIKFSFLMSIPAILGPALLDVFKLTRGVQVGISWGPLIAGMLAAAVSGYLAVRFMLRIFAKTSLKVFSYYVFILGAIIILEQIFSGRLFGRLF